MDAAILDDPTDVLCTVPSVPARRPRGTLLARHTLIIEVVAAIDPEGEEAFWVETRDSAGHLTSATSFGQARDAWSYAGRLGI